MPKRTLWIQTILFLLVSFPLVLMAYRGLPVGLGPITPFVVPLLSVISAVMLLFITRWLLKREQNSLEELGLAPRAAVFRRLAGGFVGGALLFAILALVARIVLPMRWEFNESVALGAVLLGLAHHLVTNTCEELAFRGYGFSRLRSLVGMWPAQVVVAAISAGFHLVCGWSLKVALIHTTAGSLLFALVFLRWRSVPAAIGVHAAWNWTRDLILSFQTGGSTLLTPVPDRPWGAAEWTIAQIILVGGTLLVCVGLLISLPKTQRY